MDLFEWMLEGLRRRGLARATIGADWTLSADQVASVRKAIPGARFVNLQGDCLAMQQVKTLEELAAKDAKRRTKYVGADLARYDMVALALVKRNEA